MESSPQVSSAPIDWKIVSAIDANNFDPNSYRSDEIVNLIRMIAGCSLSEFRTPTDANLLKLFRISQTLMLFLLQRTTQVKQSPASHSLLEKEKMRLDTENKKLRKVLLLHQKTFQCSLTGSFRCSQCPKTFMDQQFLDTHMEKRHPITTLDSESGLALREKIAEYNAKLGFDKKAFDEMHHELDLFKNKLTETEAVLTSEREARSLLESKIDHEISQKFRDLEDSLSDHVNANVRNILPARISSGSFVPEHDVQSEQSVKDQESRLLNNFDAVLNKHTREVQKLGKEIEVLSHKLDNASPSQLPQVKHHEQGSEHEASVKQAVHKAKAKFSDRVRTVKDKKTKAASPFKPDIGELVRRELESLQIDPQAEGVDEKSLDQALQLLQQRRKPHVSRVREKIVATLQDIINSDLHEEQPETKTNKNPADGYRAADGPLNDPPVIKTVVVDSSGKTGHDVMLRSPGILKSRNSESSLSPGDRKGRRISFNEDRIEISPTDSETNDDMDLPVARPRTSRITQHVVPDRKSDESDDDFDLSQVDISPERSPKVTAI